MLIPVAAAQEEVQEEEEGNIAAVHPQQPVAEEGTAAVADLPLQEEVESMAAAKAEIDFPPSAVPPEQSLASHPLAAQHLPAHKLEERQTRYEVGDRAEEGGTAAVRPREAAGQNHTARPKADSGGPFRGSTLDLRVFSIPVVGDEGARL